MFVQEHLRILKVTPNTDHQHDTHTATEAKQFRYTVARLHIFELPNTNIEFHLMKDERMHATIVQYLYFNIAI